MAVKFVGIGMDYFHVKWKAMSKNIEVFRKEFLNAHSWSQRKGGVPLGLLEDLSSEELLIVEDELIEALHGTDDWIVMGLGHIKSQGALPKLYNVLSNNRGAMKVTIAHAIYKICGDQKMIRVVLEEMPGIHSQYELIHVVYLLRSFENDEINLVLNELRQHKEYLVAYNATQAMGLPTEEVVQRFRNMKNSGLWNKVRKVFFK